jgi:hypothetical protein
MRRLSRIHTSLFRSEQKNKDKDMGKVEVGKRITRK